MAFADVAGQPYQYDPTTGQYRANEGTGISDPSRGPGYGIEPNTPEAVGDIFKPLGGGQMQFVGAGSPEATAGGAAPSQGTLGEGGYYYSDTPFTGVSAGAGLKPDEGLLSQLQGLGILAPFAAAAAPGLAAGAAGGGGEFGGIFAPQNIPFMQAGGAGSAFDLSNLTSAVLGGAAGGGAGASGVAGGSPESLTPQTGQALGLPSPTGAPSPTGSPTTITPPGTPGGGVTAPVGAPSILGQGESFVDKILKQLKDNPLGAVGAGLTAASLGGAKKQPLSAPESTLSNLGAGAAGLSQTLIDAYKSGTLQPGQQAQLDQTIQGAKNQINQYFASIGQSNSTAHAQALAQIDQQALSMKQNMLNNMLQQGLSAMGAAEGPLSQVSQYQLGQDRNLQQAFGNFASALGNIAGRSSGTPAPNSPPTTAPVQAPASVQSNPITPEMAAG